MCPNQLIATSINPAELCDGNYTLSVSSAALRAAKVMRLMAGTGFGTPGLVFIAIEWVGTFLHPSKTCHPVAYGPPRAPESGCLSSGPRAATAAAATLLPPARWSRAALASASQ